MRTDRKRLPGARQAAVNHIQFHESGSG
jgi:hypothetical protein